MHATLVRLCTPNVSACQFHLGFQAHFALFHTVCTRCPGVFQMHTDIYRQQRGSYRHCFDTRALCGLCVWWFRFPHFPKPPLNILCLLSNKCLPILNTTDVLPVSHMSTGLNSTFEYFRFKAINRIKSKLFNSKRAYSAYLPMMST